MAYPLHGWIDRGQAAQGHNQVGLRGRALCPYREQLVGRESDVRSVLVAVQTTWTPPPERFHGSRAGSLGYWSTLSAMASKFGGVLNPSASAIFRLIVSSYLVGACTGRSPGFSPRRMRST